MRLLLSIVAICNMVEQTGTPERKTRSRHRKVKLLEAEICEGREPETEQGGAGMEPTKAGGNTPSRDGQVKATGT